MWCARSATPDFDFPFPSNLMFPVGLASLAHSRVSAALSRSGERRHREPDEAGHHIVSGGLRNLQVYS